MKLAFGSLVTPAFRTLAIAVARAAQLDPSELMACMYFESKLDPRAINPQSGFSGLIQWGPPAAARLGTSVESIRRMTDLEQLELVRRYYVEFGYAGRCHGIADTYMAIFWPAAIGKPGSHAIIGDATSKAYVQNKGLDLNKDGNITKDEAATYAVRALELGLSKYATDEHDTRIHPKPLEQRSASTEDSPMFASLGLGLLGNLVTQIVQGFAPIAQRKVESSLAKVAGNTEDAKQLADAIMNAAKTVVGIPAEVNDPNALIAATAAVTADTPDGKAKLLQAQAATLATLDEVGAFLDRINTWQAAADARTEDSRDRANTRASNAEGWKLRWSQLNATKQAMAAALIGVVGLTIVQMLVEKKGPAEGLMVLGTALIMANVNTFRDIAGYLWGGVYHSTASSEAETELDQRRKPEPGGTKS